VPQQALAGGFRLAPRADGQRDRQERPAVSAPAQLAGAADLLRESADAVLAANGEDVSAGEGRLDEGALDRLRLDETRLDGIAACASGAGGGAPSGATGRK